MAKKNKTVSILGCGWLGFPLAEALLKNQCSVKGSTTTNSKMPLLKNAGIEPYLISVSANEVQGAIHHLLEHAEILIIDIPPKLRSENAGNFTDKIKSLLPIIEKSGIEKVIFISATSVYADDNAVVTEHTVPNPDSESGKQLLEAEWLLRKNPNIQTTILRFGGLIGEDRHPVKFLAGRENLENPDGPVNLIHQKDCIKIILKIIALDIWGETFNAAAPFHPSRKDYYTKKAIEKNLPSPQFNTEKPSVGKTIDPQRLIDVLDYHFWEAL